MQTPTEEQMLDFDNNPFIDWSDRGVRQRPTQWHQDEEACTKVLKAIKKHLKALEVMLAYPDAPPDFLASVLLEIEIWRSRLHQAIYN